MKVNIQEVDLVTTVKYASIEIFIMGIVLNVNARIGVRIFDVNGKIVDSKQLTMDGEDYKKWGDDDQYVVDFVCQKLGFTPESTQVASS